MIACNHQLFKGHRFFYSGQIPPFRYFKSTCLVSLKVKVKILCLEMYDAIKTLAFECFWGKKYFASIRLLSSLILVCFTKKSIFWWAFPGERRDVLDDFSNPFSIWKHGGFCFLELLCPQKLVYWFLVLDFQWQNICFSCFSGIEGTMPKADSLRIQS